MAKNLVIEADNWKELVAEFIRAAMATQNISVQPTNAGKSTYGKLETKLPGSTFVLKGAGIPLEVTCTLIFSQLQRNMSEWKTADAAAAASAKAQLARAIARAERFGIEPNSAGNE